MQTTAVQGPRYASRQAAAEYADCSTRTVDRWIESGTVTGYRVGRIVRVDLNEIDRVFTAGGDTL